MQTYGLESNHNHLNNIPMASLKDFIEHYYLAALSQQAILQVLSLWTIDISALTTQDLHKTYTAFERIKANI